MQACLLLMACHAVAVQQCCCHLVLLLQAPVDSPERFFVEIQFSNGANFDPTRVPANRHTMPTQNRRLLTGSPGVPLQTFQV